MWRKLGRDSYEVVSKGYLDICAVWEILGRFFDLPGNVWWDRINRSGWVGRPWKNGIRRCRRSDLFWQWTLTIYSKKIHNIRSVAKLLSLFIGPVETKQTSNRKSGLRFWPPIRWMSGLGGAKNLWKEHPNWPLLWNCEVHWNRLQCLLFVNEN